LDWVNEEDGVARFLEVVCFLTAMTVHYTTGVDRCIQGSQEDLVHRGTGLSIQRVLG
jgi:hypothetical protein